MKPHHTATKRTAPTLFRRMRDRLAKRSAPLSPTRLALEPLEDRRLLSVGPLSTPLEQPVEEGTAEIHGQKWLDLNADGIRNPGELGLDGWTIELVDPADGSVVATTVTAGVDLNDDEWIDPQTEAGRYSFTGIAPGNYEVREVMQEGWGRELRFTGLTGRLELVQTLVDGQDGVGELDGASSVTVSPDGKFVYATARSPGNAVTVFRGDWVTGELDSVQVLRDDENGIDGLYGARSISISPDGNHLYLVGASDNALAVFARDWTTGELTFVEMLRDGRDGVDGLSVPQSVTVSPDGNHVYATGRNDDAVTIFSRDENTGRLTLVGTLRDDTDGVDGIGGAAAVTVSPDGNHVYVTGLEDDALAVFGRDPDTGELSFVGMLRDQIDGVEGLDGPFSVTVSPDGKHVYAAANGSDAVAAFSRDEATGLLTFVHALQDGIGGIEYLGSPLSVTVSPDGHHVFVAGALDDAHTGDAVAVFDRDKATGRLSFRQALGDGVDGLAGTSCVAISPDGQHVYTTAVYEDAIGVFSRDFPTESYRIHVEAGEIFADRDFGNYQTASISGRVWHDLDRDAEYQQGEPGLDGWTIELIDATTGEVIDTQLTAAVDLDDSGTIDPETETGRYSFDEVVPGTYAVRQVAGDGYARTYPDSTIHSLTLSSGDAFEEIDFGNIETASILGQVFEDLDEDGERGGRESGLNGWTVELIDSQTGQVVDTRVTADMDVIADGLIDPNSETGRYFFDGVLPGSYVVRQVTGEGYTQTSPVSLDNSRTYSLTLAGGDESIMIDFGNFHNSSIRGQVFEDRDGNGTHDEGESGLNGWTVELVDSATGSVIDTRVTDSVDLDADGSIDPQTETGLYAFEPLVEGKYEVRQVMPEGWAHTSPNGPTHSIDLAYGEELVGQDFGNRGTGEIHGRKWHDINGNGLHDPGEPGLDGLTIELVDRTDGSVVATTVTAAVDRNQDGSIDPETEMGIYAFTSLPPGSYEVREVPQDAWGQSSPRTIPAGTLQFEQVLRKGQDGVDGLSLPRSVSTSPDGKHVYVASFVEVTVFRRDEATGRLTFVQTFRDGQDGANGLNGVWSLTISPDGENVYATSEIDRAVTVFTRDLATGRLTFVQTLRGGRGSLDELDSPCSVTVSPDSNHVYVTSYEDEAVAVFRRLEKTGRLVYVHVLRKQDGSVDEFNGTMPVAISPEGDHAYTAGHSRVTVFHRDETTGRLSFVHVLRDDQNGVDGLDSANSVTVSPDGRHVYTAAHGDNAVAVFSRSQMTGELEFVQMLRDGRDGVDGLDYATSVTIAPDGSHVYATARDDDAVAVFSRDETTGRLDFVQVLRDGQNRVEGLDRANSVTVSPDNRHVYVTSFGADTDDGPSGEPTLAVFSRDFSAGPHEVSLAPDEILAGRDFGNYESASVSGRAFEDRNDNGTHDAGEPGLDGWTIELLDPETGAVIDTRVTAAMDLDENGTIDPVTESGSYSFDGLAPGDYQVRDVVGAGFARTNPSPSPRSLTLLSGDTIETVDFGSALAVPITPLGEVDLTTLDGITPDASGQWYSLTTTHSALLTVVLTAGDADGVQFQLTESVPVQDQSVTPLTVSTLVRGVPRFDHHVGGGKTLYLHVAGDGSPIDLTVANLVRQVDGEVRVFGTKGDDHFEMVAEYHNLGINGIWYDFNANQTAAVMFGGSQGTNTAMIHGTPGVESAEIWADRAEIDGEGYGIVLAKVTAITVDGLGGDDDVVFHDSADDDEFIAWPGGGLMRSDGIEHRVDNFENVVARATSGGIDTAKFFDSPGNDRYVGTPKYNSLSGDRFHNEARFFEASHAYATGGGVDEAKFYDSTGDDAYVTTPTYAALFNTDYRDENMAQGFYSRAKFFEGVHAYATAGGVDVASFYDSNADDDFVATPTYAALFNSEYQEEYTNGFYNRAKFFEAAHAFATAGGVDEARLYDSREDDTFYADPTHGALYGDGFYNRAKYFEAVHAFATAGGLDKARLHDSSADDTFYADPTHGALFNATYQESYTNGFYNRAKYFEEIYATAGEGDDDRATLSDSAGSSDLLDGDIGRARLTNATLDLLYEAAGFDHVKAKASDDDDTNELPDAGLLRFELELEGPW